MAIKALRGAVLTFHDDPFVVDPASAFTFIDDGLVVIQQGRIVRVGAYAELSHGLDARVRVTHYPDAIICPGFVDAHVHYPQTQIIGAFGEQLLEWLNRYTYPAEQQFHDKRHADEVSALFLRELLRAGTTTAAVYCTVHPQSVDAFFEESERFNTRMIAGKVMMDRNAPAGLLDTLESSVRDSAALIGKWHGRGRQLYCVTPRFAGSSTPAQLEAAGRLWKEHPGTYMQTHLCENTQEIEWVKGLYPDRAGYLDVYHQAGLTGPRAIFGHGVHLSEQDFHQCHHTGSALAHCPTSNTFLGSGLFRIFDAKRAGRPVRVGVGTDIGAGTSFSQLRSLGEAYKVAALNQTRLTAAHAFYLATRGGAQALYLEDAIGSIAPGMEADLTVLDLRATPLMAFRMRHCHDVLERLFVLMTLGDERVVQATYVAGEKVYDRDRTARPFRYPGLKAGGTPQSVRR
jgi:guanine deaminase